MDYAFTHNGQAFTPNGSDVAVSDVDARNTAIETAELAHWETKPDRMLAYFRFPAEHRSGLWRDAFRVDCTDATVATWLGTTIGRIIRANVYRHNFGGRHVSITVRGTNGATYYGRASYDNGQCVWLKRAKGSK